MSIERNGEVALPFWSAVQVGLSRVSYMCAMRTSAKGSILVLFWGYLTKASAFQVCQLRRRRPNSVCVVVAIHFLLPLCF